MSPRDTLSCIGPFLVLEHLFCLNRTYLMDSWKMKSLCLAFNCLSFAYTLVMNVFIHHKCRVNASMVWLQVISLTYLLYLVYAARSRQSFEMLKKLDEIFGGDDRCHYLLKNRVLLATTLLLTSSVSDVAVWHYVAGYVYYSCVWAVVFSRECELLLYGLLIESINIKLLRLDGAKPSKGARAYRQALMCSAKIYQDFELRVLSIIMTKFLATIAILAYYIIYSAQDILLLILWRFLHWHLIFFVVCYSSYRTSAICRVLCMKLCARLALTHEYDSLYEREILRRWITAMETKRPTFGARPLPLTITTPLTLLDLSATYLLVVLQLFNAYKT